MEKNLKLLDKFDRDRNIYELICKLSDRAHGIMSGNSVSPETRESNPVQIAMEEFLFEGNKTGQ